MKNILLSPDSTESSVGAVKAPAKRAANKSGAKAVSGKESPLVSCVHEIFRSQGMDLRESERTVALVNEFAALAGKGAK